MGSWLPPSTALSSWSCGSDLSAVLSSLSLSLSVSLSLSPVVASFGLLGIIQILEPISTRRLLGLLMNDVQFILACIPTYLKSDKFDFPMSQSFSALDFLHHTLHHCKVLLLVFPFLAVKQGFPFFHAHTPRNFLRCPHTL